MQIRVQRKWNSEPKLFWFRNEEEYGCHAKGMPWRRQSQTWNLSSFPTQATVEGLNRVYQSDEMFLLVSWCLFLGHRNKLSEEILKEQKYGCTITFQFTRKFPPSCKMSTFLMQKRPNSPAQVREKHSVVSLNALSVSPCFSVWLLRRGNQKGSLLIEYS